MTQSYIAVDFGGGSGRVIAGTIAYGKLKLEEIHRFDNRLVTVCGHAYWDVLSLYAEMVEGLRKAVESGYHIDSIGIDTWGVDFGFIDRHGKLLGTPVSYRDRSNDGVVADFFNLYPTQADHYAEAGIQIMDINTLFRLVKMHRTAPDVLEVADKLLFTPDLFSYFLTGKANNEYTIASTSGLIDAKTRRWNEKLIAECGLPRRLFGDLIQPGEVRGMLTDEVMAMIGVGYPVPVIAVGSHDTASAVFSVREDYDTSRTAYLSSGTWSLLGVAISDPILTEEARIAGFTNEGGVDGKIRFLQNITGLWILQQLIKQWRAKGLPVDFDHLMAEAESSDIESVIDVDNQSFHNPANMSDAIDSYCMEHGQKTPSTQGEYVRCVLRSLAVRYKKGVVRLNAILPYRLEKLQIIGGGSRNSLLNKLTAEETGLRVQAGPTEATAIGNILLQARTAGAISSAAEIEY